MTVFRNAADSLSQVYPDSKYVRALRQEADSRTRQLELRVRLQTAEQIGYPDIELPDVNGKKVKLSDVDSKAVLVFFWSPADAEQKMFNLDVLKDIYSAWHGKGLEIYQVAISTDKAGWARTVKDQGLGWINVCDGLGTASSAVSTYNLSALPVSFILSDGQMLDERVTDAASLRRVLDRLLK